MIVYKHRVYMPEENKIIPRIDTTMPNSGLGIMVASQRQRTGLGWPMRGEEGSEKGAVGKKIVEKSFGHARSTG